ncbi:energy-coupling factor transporter transmembrane component T family protein [Apilactobacillus xinyiensis]|uniref:energy-coupling factor transporter transmembrane component T family protein n=1 Tax=Apilactobacillus xinyiensis TaxID=2841032 RepID=UPI001C7CE393|nr:energy-coupling factor transporter transmembrane component T [Apilactobacillus xinyiensis]MCL0318578.1 energy-coupling factor transporter transmembrane protein EcfT [Apilactobacillus xinyiensis]
MNNSIFGYDGNDTWIHKLTGTSKLIFFILVSIISMISYDVRFTLLVLVLSAFIFQQSKIKWQQIKLVVKLIVIFAILNLITVYIFSPGHGSYLYGTRHVIFNFGYLTMTQEQLFYELNLAIKYLVTVPISLVFLITTNPSEFSASLNQIGVPYRFSYAVSLALRYIPDVQQDFQSISLAQQARGYEISKKGKVMDRIKGTSQILVPLILSSLDKIQVISQAMELRRFGKNKSRTWYMHRKFSKNDYLTLLLAILIILIGILFIKIDGSRFFNPFK